MKVFIYSFFLLLLSPCNSPKSTAKTTQSDNSTVVIVYHTTACFGRCPIYSLTINGDSKTAIFIGEKDTEKIGTYSKSVSDKELNDFVKAFEDAKFNDLNDEYLGTITDFPFKYITYTNNGKTKKIKERSGAPKELTTLEKILNEYANSDGWKRTAGAPGNAD